MIEVKQIKPTEAYQLRHLVLWPHIDKVEDCIIDIDDREDAIHVGAFDKADNLIGICSLFEMNSSRLNFKKQYRLRAMATHPDFRGSGVGKAIVAFSIEFLKDKGYEVLWCDARKIAFAFYDKIGFDTIDEWYDVQNVGLHKTMYCKL